MPARELWVLAGQSNMEGIGALDGPVEPPHEDVRTFTHEGRWERAAEPLHWILESPDPVHASLMGIPQGEVASARAQARQTRSKPDRDTLIQATAVTVVFCLVAAVYLGLLDLAFNWLVQKVIE